MNALDWFKNHHHTINNYLVIYAVSMALLMVTAYLFYRYNDAKLFYKGVFFTLLLVGTLLASAGLSFRARQLREISKSEIQYQQDPDLFLKEKLEAAAAYKPHFYRLLTIWGVAIIVLLLLCRLLLSKPTIVGVFCSLIICCMASLLLDFAGFQSDAHYYKALKKLTLVSNGKNNQ